MTDSKKYLDFTGLTNLVNSIKNLFSKSVADWNQNDENDYSYIKNRICYETDPINTEYLSETSISIEEIYQEENMAYGEISVSEVLQIDQKYTVVFDGTIYENLVCFDDYDYPCIGSPINNIINGSAEYPFNICTYSESDNIFLVMYVDDIVSTSHTIQITWYKTNIIKIEDKYLPDLPKGSFVGQKGTGSNAEIFNDYDNNIASGMYAHAEGFHARATGTYGHAEGVYSEASGNTSHAEGKGTVADGANVHAEGCLTTASASETHAEGYYTKASSKYQHVQGKCNIEDAENKYAHIVGNGESDTERSNAHTLDWDGNAWYAGDIKIGGSSYSDSETKTLATTEYVDTEVSNLSNTIDLDSKMNVDNPVGTGSFSMNRKAGTTIGNGSFASGYNTTASGEYSHTEGINTEATNICSHAEGVVTKSNGDGSHTEGGSTVASGIYSHAEGSSTKSYGSYSHAEGESSEAVGKGSHAEGNHTKANSQYSHTEGNYTKAYGYNAHAEGDTTEAASENQHVQGKYNIVDNSGIYAHIVGNGTSSSALSNAHTLDWSGNAWFAGTVSASEPVNSSDLTTKNYVDASISTTNAAIDTAINNSIADWNQNNETSSSYIKNRICYESDPVDTEFLAETTINDFSNHPSTIYWSDTNTTDTPLIIGQKYTVVLSGVTYENLECFEDYGYPTIGSTYDDLYNESPEYLFCIASRTGENNILDISIHNTLSPEDNTSSDDINYYTFTLQIIWHKTTITKINEKFLDFPAGSKIGAAGEGKNAEVFNNYSSNVATGLFAHAEGNNTTATGYYSHAEGMGSTAAMNCCHAEGSYSYTSGIASHAEGYYTKASGDYQHVQGKYNIEDTENKFAHIVGNGTAETSRANIHTLDWNGNSWYKGTVEGTGLILKSSTAGSTKRFKITVDDTGTLNIAEITE